MPEETMPDYNYHFHRDDIEAALACMDEYGFCVIQQMIDQEMVTALRDSIDRHLDPDGDLGPASNRYHMAFAEDSEPVWDLADNPAYMRFIRTVHGSYRPLSAPFGGHSAYAGRGHGPLAPGSPGAHRKPPARQRRP